ncbi:hypothetical protein HHK36_026748 [Tetracentron sinense]|uniref:N-acetyltransferase domain-containing protein n=1 Tax=Tetracentron sinense TaxID=13715 RepID=A0A835D4W6_TETSI|nr:hypothetical protein HHK36_026748 [Tetracentron sinense]
MEVMENPMKLTLRAFKVSDVDDFMEWASDEEVTRYCRWNTYTSREDALNFLEDVIMSHPWYRAICIDHRPVGSIYVMPGTGKNGRRGEIGYALGSKYWGQGIATLAVKMVVSCVFKDLPYLERVEGLVYAENKGSQMVLEKAGFVKEGVLRKYFFVKGESRDIVVYIGSIYVMPETGKDGRRGEIGYALGSKYWGQGIATLAVKMVVSCVFKDLPYLERVEGLVYAENKGSQMVLEKAGFVKEGVLRKYFFVKGESRDIVVYSLVHSDAILI